MQNNNQKFIQLVSRFNELKEIEKKAQEERLQVELEIFNLVKSDLKDEGTNRFKINDLADFKIVTGFTKKYDQKLLADILKNNPQAQIAFNVEYKEDKRVFEKLPSELKSVLDCASEITIKKPSFSIEIKGMKAE